MNKMETIIYKDKEICIEKDGEGFYAFCPALKGLHTYGITKDEAIKNAKCAVNAYQESIIKHRKTFFN